MMYRAVTLLLLSAFLAGCASTSTSRRTTAPVEKKNSVAKPAPKYGGGYYKDDGPGDEPPPDMDAIPDAVPRSEPLHRFANNPYTVLGQTYTPFTGLRPYKARGVASWYGRKFHGQKTSSGEPYDMYGMTAAHPVLPIPSYVRVTNPANGRSVVLRVNDRGPFHADRLIDLTYTAAYKLDLLQNGSGQVEVELLDPSRPDAISPEPAPEVAAIPLEAIPIARESGGVFLQLGAFRARQNAESFGSRLKQELGKLADAMSIYTQGGLFRVHLGPYRTQAEARLAADEIRQALQIAPVVVVR